MSKILQSIKDAIAAMVTESDEIAEEDVEDSAPEDGDIDVPYTPDTPLPPEEPTEPTTPDEPPAEDSWENALVPREYKGDNSKLNTSTSIVDLLKSHDYSSEFKDRANLYKAMKGSGVYTGSSSQNRFMINTMKAKGYKIGSSNIPYDQMSSVHDGELVLKRVSDGGYLADLTAGSKVLTESQVQNMLNWSKLNPQMFKHNVSIPSMPTIQNKQMQSAPQIHDLNVTFELPNVKDSNDFITDLRTFGENAKVSYFIGKWCSLRQKWCSKWCSKRK